MTTPEEIARIAKGLSDGEKRRLLDGRTDWRADKWQDHCGDWDCGLCTGYADTHINPERLSEQDKALRTYLMENPQ